MRGTMRLLWFGMTVLGLLYWTAAAGAACNNGVGEALYDRPLYNDELSVALPKDWRLVQSEPPGILKYDDIIHYVQLGGRRLFGIDFTQNDNVLFVNTTSTNVTNNGIWATEYRRDGVLTNVVVKPPCGGFRYVIMWFITKDPGERRQVEASMRSIKCIAPPRPLR